MPETPLKPTEPTGVEDVPSFFEAREPFEYVKLFWQAEEENARRQSARTNLLFSIIALSFGVGLFRIDFLTSVAGEPWPVRLLTLMPLALALGAFAMAMIIILWARDEPESGSRGRAGSTRVAPDEALADNSVDETGLASAEFKRGFLEELAQAQTRADSHKVLFNRVLRAATTLHERNATQKRRIDQAQRAMLIAVLGIVVALLGSMLKSWYGATDELGPAHASTAACAAADR